MIRTLFSAPSALSLALCLAVAPSTFAQDTVTTQAQARKELVSVIRDQTKSHREVLREAYGSLNDKLKIVEAAAKSGSMTADEMARDVHQALRSFVGLMKTLTAFVASEVSVDAGDILAELDPDEYSVHFSTGSGRDLDRALERLEKANAGYAKKITKRIASTARKVSKLGYELTARVVTDLPVGIAPNAEFSYTSLNFDTIIDVLVGCSHADESGDGTLVVGGISNPAKGLDITVQINGADGAEITTMTAITGDRWVVVFDSSETPMPEGNYRVIAVHESTRVGTTMGLR